MRVGPLFLTEKHPQIILTICLWSYSCFITDDKMLPGVEDKDPGDGPLPTPIFRWSWPPWVSMIISTTVIRQSIRNWFSNVIRTLTSPSELCKSSGQSTYVSLATLSKAHPRPWECTINPAYVLLNMLSVILYCVGRKNWVSNNTSTRLVIWDL